MSLINLIKKLSELAIGIEPNLTLIINADPQKSLNRGLKRTSNETRFEMLGLRFQEEAKLRYEALAKNIDRCHIVDGNGGIEETHQLLWKIVSNNLRLQP